MWMEGEEPGCPEPDVICRPLALPSRALVTEVTGRSSSFLLSMFSAEPVNEDFFDVP